MVRSNQQDKLESSTESCSPTGKSPVKKITQNYRGPRSGEDFYESFENIALHQAVLTYLCFVLLNILGRLQDFLRKHGILKNYIDKESPLQKDFVPLYSDYESFYTRNLYRRVRDCWNRPITSNPGVEFDVMHRVTPDFGWTFNYTGKTMRVLNFGSYNYLGFGSPEGPWIDESLKAVDRYGLGSCSTRAEVGTIDLHRKLEHTVATYVGQEDAVITAMGFATNSLNMPCIFDKNSCIISDELNHNSLILGCRLSGATIVRFKHNDMADLERQLQKMIIYGRPRTHRPYKKIFIVVEGIYSMEGSIVHLPELIALKKKYKAYLYLDEAHSIGALGKTGRGVVDYFGCDPKDIDIAMGTFTKSFGAAGGYLAGKKHLIDYIRSSSQAIHYGGVMPAPVVQQILSTFDVLMGRNLPGEGEFRLAKLAWNTRYFRARCHEMGVLVYGNRDSPVVPMIINMPAKLISFSRECLARGLGTVVVGFPATPLLLARARFCISANHNKIILDRALDVIKECVEAMQLNFSRMKKPNWCMDAIMAPEPQREEFCGSFRALLGDRREESFRKHQSQASGSDSYASDNSLLDFPMYDHLRESSDVILYPLHSAR